MARIMLSSFRKSFQLILYKEMYQDQSGELLCGYLGLKGQLVY